MPFQVQLQPEAMLQPVALVHWKLASMEGRVNPRLLRFQRPGPIPGLKRLEQEVDRVGRVGCLGNHLIRQAKRLPKAVFVGLLLQI